MPPPAAGAIGLVHKPVGPSSFARLNEVIGPPGAPGRPKACHGGALDPFADGLLLVLVGWGTYLFEALHRLPKTYVAEVVWGTETDNGDPTGRVVAQGSAAPLAGCDLDQALAPFLGWTEQVPPITSNKRVGGEPAWRRAHRGEAVELPPSRVYLHAARWLAHDLPRRSRLELTSAGGYYVRAMVRDLGRALGVPAHVGALRRTDIGPFGLDRAGAWLRGTDAVTWLPSTVLSDPDWNRLRGTRALGPVAVTPPRWTPPGGFPYAPDLVVGTRKGGPAALLEPVEGGYRARATWTPTPPR